MGGCYEFETKLKLGGQKVVLVLTIQMSALYLCSVKKVILGMLMHVDDKADLTKVSENTQ